MSSAHRYEWTRQDGSTGKAWRAKWVGVDGKARYKRGFDRKSDAESYASDREAEVRHGVKLEGDMSQSKTTVEAWAKTWLAGVEARPQTVASYSAAIKRINADLGGRTLASLRPSEMRAWRRNLTSAGRMADSTAQHTAAIFQMILRAAVQDGLLTKSPLPPGKGGSSAGTGRIVEVDELLTIEQVVAWAAKLPARLRAAPILAATTGIRQGELLGLQVGDVDFPGRKIRVWQQLVQPLGPGRPDYGPPKTAAGTRMVPLSERASFALAQHLAEFPSPAGEPIFLTSGGKRWRRSAFRDEWVLARDAAKLPDWAHWHALRDVAASTLIRSGTDLRAVMSIMGHTSSEETLRTYARIWPDAQDVARKAIDDVWSAAEGQGSATGPSAAGQDG